MWKTDSFSLHIENLACNGGMLVRAKCNICFTSSYTSKKFVSIDTVLITVFYNRYFWLGDTHYNLSQMMTLLTDIAENIEHS